MWTTASWPKRSCLPLQASQSKQRVVGVVKARKLRREGFRRKSSRLLMKLLLVHYSEKRMLFIASSDLPHAAASKAWLHSQERKTLLSKLSVKELLGRRFVPPGTRVNPFAE